MASEVYPHKDHPVRQRYVRQLALFVCFAASLCGADEAAKIFEQGRKAERAGHMAEAYLLYSRAAALAPDNQFYWVKSQAVQARAALESPPKAPDSETKAGSAKEDTTGLDAMDQKDHAAVREPRPPVELKPAPGRKDFDLRGDAKTLWEQVARAFGLETVFDGDYQLRFNITDSDYRDALHGLEAATGSFVVPVSPKIVLVVKDTEQKRREVEPVEAVVIGVPQATTAQELTEIAQAVRQLFTLEKVAFDTQENKVVLRGRVSLIEPARILFEELLHHRPQVSIEVAVMEVDYSSSLIYGLDLTPTLPLTYLGSIFNSPISIPSGVTGVLKFGGGQTVFGIGVATATMMAQMNNASTRTLAKGLMRAVDGTPSTLHVGTRLPVLTAGYFGPQSFSQGGQVFTPPPSFTFEDLGVNMKITPKVNGVEEVTLDLDTEFKVVTGQSINGIPVISNRKLTTKVRLHEGESAVVAGLMNVNQARSINGVAGLADVPVLGQLFRQTNKNEQTSEVFMVIKPTLLNLPPDETVTPTIFTGSETRPLTPL